MTDRREVRVRLTVPGEAILWRLTVVHRAELRNSGPRLVDTLGRLLERVQAEETPGAKEEDVSADPERHP